MRSSLFFVTSAFWSSVFGQAIQFTNTNFTAPVVVGQVWHIEWTNGNGQPVDLVIGNSTWSFPIFTHQNIPPNSLDLQVPAPAGFAAGRYQLSLDQVGSDPVFSPIFLVTMPAGQPMTTAPMSMSTSMSMMPTTTTDNTSSAMMTAITTTVTYVYWDHDCGCTKTGTAATPIGLNSPLATITYFEQECGCHKSTVLPVSTITPVIQSSNYTVPALSMTSAMATAMATAPITTATPATTVAPASIQTSSVATFTGGVSAVRVSGGILGGAFVLVAAIMA